VTSAFWASSVDRALGPIDFTWCSPIDL